MNRYMIAALVVALWGACVNYAYAFPIEAQFSWTFPDAREDGTPMGPEEVQSINVLCYKNGTPVFEQAYLTNGLVLESAAGAWDGSSGDYECYAITVDTTGLTSDPSNTAIKKVTGKPGAPLQFIFDGYRQ